MRSILLLIVFFGLLPYIIIKPHIGVLVYSWISYMNPHRLTWGFTYDFGFAQIAAIVTLFAWLISREPKRIPMNGLTIIMGLFTVWICITTYFSLQPIAAQKTFEETVKIMTMAFVTLGLIYTRERLQVYIWVVALSIGFYGVKGGIFVIATAGNYMVFGPEESMLESNNDMGMAMAMIVPMLRYLQLEAKSKWVRWGMGAAMVLCILAAFGTYSRGAVIGFCAMAVMFWLKSPRKVLIGTAGLVALVASLAFMPGKWTERLESVQEYQSDWSSMDRIKMWRFGVNVALGRPLVGGGFEVFPNWRVYSRFGLEICHQPQFLEATADCVLKPRSSHSNYFEVLGEHGFVGFGLYMMILVMAFFYGSWILRKTRGREDLLWAHNLAAMLQTSLVGYMAVGLFINRAYFDLYWSVVIMMIVTRMLVSQALKAEQSDKRASGDPWWTQQPAATASPAAPQAVKTSEQEIKHPGSVAGGVSPGGRTATETTVRGRRSPR